MLGIVLIVGFILLFVGFIGHSWWRSTRDYNEQEARKALIVLEESQRQARLTPEERAAEQAALEAKESAQIKATADIADLLAYGEVNAAMLCPHCGERGLIRTKKVLAKKGISGGKATAAVLTGGISVIGTGLSRNEVETKAHCDFCKNDWAF